MDWIKLSSLPGQKLDSEEFGFNYWKIEDGSVWHQKRRLRKADPESFEIRTDFSERFIARDKDHIFHAWSLVGKIDRDTFDSAGGGYWVDKNFAYYEYGTSIRPLKGNDSSNFKFIGGPYARDSSFAYYAGRIIKACEEPMKLQLVDERNVWFAGDLTKVYYDGAQIRGVDFDSWQLVRDTFSTDCKAVYFCNKRLPFVKRDSWEILQGGFSRDERSVYQCNFKIKDADRDSWVFLEHWYSKDRQNVFYGSDQIPGADPESFEVINDSTAKDKNNNYDGGDPV